MGDCYDNENVFPIIGRIITQICQEKRTGTFKLPEATPAPRSSGIQIPSFAPVTSHDSDPAGRHEIVAACRCCPARSEDWLAANMVAWWSQTITQGRNLYGRRYDRIQRKGKWAYKPKIQGQ